MKKEAYLMLFLSGGGIIDLNFAMITEEKCSSEEESSSGTSISEESKYEMLDNATDYLKSKIGVKAKKISELVTAKTKENKQMLDVFNGLDYLNDFFFANIAYEEAKKERNEKLLESKEKEMRGLEGTLKSEITQSMRNEYQIRCANLQQKINKQRADLVNLQEMIYNKYSKAAKNTSELLAFLNEHQKFYEDKAQYEEFCNIMNDMASFMENETRLIVAQIWFALHEKARAKHRGLIEVRNTLSSLYLNFSNEIEKITKRKNPHINGFQNLQMNINVPANYLENFRQTFFYRVYGLHYNALQMLNFLKINKQFYKKESGCTDFCRLLNNTIHAYNPSSKLQFSPCEKFGFYYPHYQGALTQAKTELVRNSAYGAVPVDQKKYISQN